MNFPSAKNWEECSTYPVVLFRLTQYIDFKTPLAKLPYRWKKKPELFLVGEKTGHL